MSISYEDIGRTQQKARTRNALIEATRELLAQGVAPTIEKAAAAASISRATAYRYFPNQRALLVATHPEIETRSLLGDTPPVDPVERLDAVSDALTRSVVANEAELRTMLMLSLEPEPAGHDKLLLRRGRRIGWIEDALSPLRGQVPESDLRRVVHAIAATLGIEALVWLTDIAGLSTRQAVRTMRWSARALLQSALADSGALHSDKR
jgi:AcrR family transcriptional regulator